MRQVYHAKYSLEILERVIGKCRSAFEHVLVAVLAFHDDRIASVGRFTSLAEIALEFGKCRFHRNQII